MTTIAIIVTMPTAVASSANPLPLCPPPPSPGTLTVADIEALFGMETLYANMFVIAVQVSGSHSTASSEQKQTGLFSGQARRQPEVNT